MSVNLEEFYAINDAEKAVDLIFEYFDDLFLDDKFQQANEILETIDLDKLDSNKLIALLSITLAAKERLPHRSRFFAQVERILLATRGEEKTKRLLSGLE